MEQGLSRESNWFSASQETPRILWYPKVHYRIHMFLLPVPILSQLDPVHTPTSHYLKIHPNIIIPSMPGFPSWSLNLRCLHKNSVYTVTLPISATCPSHLVFLALITRIIFGEEYRSLNSSLCSFLHSSVTSSLLDPNVLLYTLFSNTLSLRAVNY